MPTKPLQPNRNDGRHQTLAGVVLARLKKLTPALTFDPAWSAQQAQAWRRKVRLRLKKCMGIGRVTKQPAPVLLSQEQRPGYRLQRWELYPDAESVVPMVMLVPDAAARGARTPAVLCLPGSDHTLELLTGEPERPGVAPNNFPEHNAMALHMVRAGYIALCIENPGTGSMAGPENADWMRQSFELAWMGSSYEAVSLSHKIAAYRWLRKLAMVDADRIAVCGHSLGAKAALLLGVIESGIRAVVWNSLAHDYRDFAVKTNLTRNAPWQYVPGFIQWFDYLDLMAALAPMPLMISEGGHRIAMQRVRAAYRLAGAASNLTVNHVERLRRGADRVPENRPLPEGITAEEYCRLSNAGVDQHRFQHDTVMPWLKKQLKAE
jgi:hypothetical protein